MSSARPPSGIGSSAFLSSLSAANRLNGPKESTSLDCRLRRSFIGVVRVSRGPSVRVHAERTRRHCVSGRLGRFHHGVIFRSSLTTRFGFKPHSHSGACRYWLPTSARQALRVAAADDNKRHLTTVNKRFPRPLRKFLR